MFTAGVSEAAIDQHDDSLRRKREVSPASWHLCKDLMDPVTRPCACSERRSIISASIGANTSSSVRVCLHRK